MFLVLLAMLPQGWVSALGDVGDMGDAGVVGVSGVLVSNWSVLIWG